jgi:hypothetical protein
MEFAGIFMIGAGNFVDALTALQETGRSLVYRA